MTQEFVPLLVAAAMVWTTLSFVKHIRAGQTGDAITVLILVAVGVGIAALGSVSSYAADLGLKGANFADCVFVGFGFSSTARTLYEFKKAVDGGDSAREAKLIPDA